MKKVYKAILLLVLFYCNQNIIAQPYINFRITDFYPVSVNDSNFVEPLSNVGRFNLNTMNLEEYLTDYIVKYLDIVWDPTESYAVINLEEKENLIYNLKSNQVMDQVYEWHNLIAVLYSPIYNNLYVFSNNEIEDFPIMFSVYNVNTKRIVSTSGVSAYAGDINYICKPEPDIFFSNDGKFIYISTNDTTTFTWQIWTYSLESNSVISKRNLSNFGFPNMFGYSMSYGIKGKGIICSYNEYNESTRQLYYNVFDFDNNKSTGFINKNTVNNEYYLTSNGKYLIFISSLGDSSVPTHHTGLTEIYDTESGQLLKSYNLPPNGIVYSFDNFPNNLYYVKDIELPTRQIFTLKMDSIFNELNLSSLTPSTATVNSPSFTLVAKGRGFDSSSTVYFNGQTRTTTFVSDSLLTAQILSTDISVAGNFPVWATDKWAVSDTLQFTVTQSSSLNLIVNLKSSQGALLTTGSLQYYEGSWKDAVNNGDGTFTVLTNLNTVSLRMAF